MGGFKGFEMVVVPRAPTFPQPLTYLVECTSSNHPKTCRLCALAHLKSSTIVSRGFIRPISNLLDSHVEKALCRLRQVALLRIQHHDDEFRIHAGDLKQGESDSKISVFTLKVMTDAQ